MKKTNILIAVALSFASAAAFAGGSSTAAPTAGTSGLAGVSAAVGGAAAAGLSGGSSQSGAQSLQTATIAVTSSAQVPGGNNSGAQQANIGAVGTTASQGFAYNLSTGAATGSADMTGTAYQAAAGSATTGQVGNPAQNATGWPNAGAGWQQGCIIDCHPATPATNPYIAGGTATGSESSVSQQAIYAGANQGGAIASVSGGNFGADVGFTTNSQAIAVPGAGNTVTTQNGNGLQLTAGAIGGTYAQTVSTNGVYQDGSSINFGGASNFVPTTSALNSASGAFAGNAAINGSLSNGTPVNVQSPL